MRKGKYLKQEDFDNIKDLQNHNYTATEASLRTGWSVASTSRVFGFKDYDEHQEYIKQNNQHRNPGKTKKIQPELPMMSVNDDTVRSLVDGIYALALMVKNLKDVIVDNSKSNYVLRNSLDANIEKLMGRVPDENEEELEHATSNAVHQG